jgi:hypothetical protein
LIAYILQQIHYIGAFKKKLMFLSDFISSALMKDLHDSNLSSGIRKEG